MNDQLDKSVINEKAMEQVQKCNHLGCGVYGYENDLE
jgi:hypothetical protein